MSIFNGAESFLHTSPGHEMGKSVSRQELRGVFLYTVPDHEMGKSIATRPPGSKTVPIWPIRQDSVHVECL